MSQRSPICYVRIFIIVRNSLIKKLYFVLILGKFPLVAVSLSHRDLDSLDVVVQPDQPVIVSSTSRSSTHPHHWESRQGNLTKAPARQANTLLGSTPQSQAGDGASGGSVDQLERPEGEGAERKGLDAWLEEGALDNVHQLALEYHLVDSKEFFFKHHFCYFII